MHSRLNKNACFILILLVRHMSAAENALLLWTIFGTIAIDIAIAMRALRTIAIDCDFHYWPTLLDTPIRSSKCGCL